MEIYKPSGDITLPSVKYYKNLKTEIPNFRTWKICVIKESIHSRVVSREIRFEARSPKIRFEENGIAEKWPRSTTEFAGHPFPDRRRN